MANWFARQYADIRGNLKWAAIVALWWTVTTFGKKMLSLIPNIPQWLVYIILFLFSMVAFFWVSKLIARSRGPAAVAEINAVPEDEPAPATPPWYAQMAKDDAKFIRDRVWWIWDDPQPTYSVVNGGDPYITFRVTFVNATIFRLTALRTIEGETFYGRDPLRDVPRIMNQESLSLVLDHAARISVLVRQPLSREVAFRLNEQRGRVALNFGKVGIDFKVENPAGMAAPETFRLSGTDVIIAIRD
jgi:hypothetical protein